MYAPIMFYENVNNFTFNMLFKMQEFFKNMSKYDVLIKRNASFENSLI